MANEILENYRFAIEVPREKLESWEYLEKCIAQFIAKEAKRDIFIKPESVKLQAVQPSLLGKPFKKVVYRAKAARVKLADVELRKD